MFDPKTNKFPYTEYTDQHYLKLKKDNGLVYDSNYPYIDKRKSFRFKRWLIRVLLYLFVFLVARIRMGLRIKGRKNIRKNKKFIKNGVVTICNHVHMWDFIGVMRGMIPYKPNLLVWGPNIRGENSKLIRLIGGIPIPDDNLGGTMAYIRAVTNELNNGGWLHIYAEGSMWEYYAPIRPFKRGATYFACKCNKPVIPLAYSYRKPGWIRRKIFKQIACLTLHIGEPIYKNDALNEKEQELDLTRRCHEAVCRLAGIDPKDNLYGPIFNNDKRVDYYTKEYGVGYKGSW